jgi:hypothetical protein
MSLVLRFVAACGILLFASCLLAVHAAEEPTGKSWYIAPTGDDTAAGTLEQPFATLAHAQQAVAPGDTVFVRGGTYALQEAQIAQKRGIFARAIVLDKSGTREKPITYRAYEGEQPIFDCSAVKPKDQRVTIFYVSGAWLRLSGLEVTGVQVTQGNHTQSICFESQGSHNILERLRLHDGQAIGIYHVRGSDNLFLNCDAWNNWDNVSEDGKGGNVDGFGCHPTSGSTGNVFRGCRAWFNSDDGYDCISAYESVTFEQCWAMYNGYNAKFEKLADGNGFKIGGFGSHAADKLPKAIPRHITQDCLAVRNKASGFYANHQPGGGDWIHNSASRNSANFNMRGRQLDNTTEIPGADHRLLFNLSFGTKRELVEVDEPKCELRGNTFGQAKQLTKDDFQSLEEAELTQPRQKDGALPKIKFLQLTAESDWRTAVKPEDVPGMRWPQETGKSP